MTVLRAIRSDAIDRFVLPEELEARRPAESRGLERDGVKLMVASSRGIRHRRFTDIHTELAEGDLLVVNNSRTLPASVVVDASTTIHFSTRQPGGFVVVEPRLIDGVASRRHPGVHPGVITLPGGAMIELIAPYPVGSLTRRLWLASADFGEVSVDDYLSRWGRPIRYRHVDGAHPLEAYQTVFSSVPGSAEMPSAGRPFSGRVLAALASKGVTVAPITLHTGVSSLESGEPPYPEWYTVSEATAALVNHTRAGQGRIVAVGTTVIRALETAADGKGQVHPAQGWTDLVVDPSHTLQVADGLVTGWHEPGSTHLGMLEAVAGRSLLSSAYQAALDAGYLWHEFGDSLLLLPEG